MTLIDGEFLIWGNLPYLKAISSKPSITIVFLGETILVPQRDTSGAHALKHYAHTYGLRNVEQALRVGPLGTWGIVYVHYSARGNLKVYFISTMLCFSICYKINEFQ